MYIIFINIKNNMGNFYFLCILSGNMFYSPTSTLFFFYHFFLRHCSSQVKTWPRWAGTPAKWWPISSTEVAAARWSRLRSTAPSKYGTRVLPGSFFFFLLTSRFGKSLTRPAAESTWPTRFLRVTVAVITYVYPSPRTGIRPGGNDYQRADAKCRRILIGHYSFNNRTRN